MNSQDDLRLYQYNAGAAVNVVYVDWHHQQLQLPKAWQFDEKSQRGYLRTKIVLSYIDTHHSPGTGLTARHTAICNPYRSLYIYRQPEINVQVSY